jgi:ribosomal protein S7
MASLNIAELRPILDVAYRRIRGLRTEISVGRDEGGRKKRALQRIELYASVLERLDRADALMPEIIGAQERHHSTALDGEL